MNSDYQRQAEAIRRKQEEERLRRQRRINAATSIGKTAINNRDKIAGLVNKFTNNNNVATVAPEIQNQAPSLLPSSSGLTPNTDVLNMDFNNALKTDIPTNTTANTATNAGTSMAQGIGGSIGGAAGGQAGSWGAGKLSDAIGIDGVGKDIAKTAGSIGGSMAGSAITNAATNAIASSLASGATSAAAGAGAAGAAGAGAAGAAGSTLAAGSALGPAGLAAAAVIAALQYGFNKFKEKKAKQKQNAAMAKAYSEQGAKEMQDAAANAEEQSSMARQAMAETLQPQPEVQQPQIPTDIKGYQQYLRDNGYSEDAVAGIEQGLNGGDKNVSDWIDTYNKGNPDSAIRIPQTEEEIALAREGKFNQDQGILDKVGDIMSQIKSGYNENRGSSFALENLAPDENKTGWNRLGEALGTGARIVSNPYVQGAVAGTLHGIDKGDALYGLNQGWNYAQGKAKSDKYYEAITGRKDAPIMATYDADDYKAHIKKVNDQREYDRKLYNDEADRLNKDEDQKAVQQKHKETIRHNKAMEAIAAERNKNTGKKNGMLTPFQRAQIINMMAQNEDKKTIDALNMLLLDDDVENFSI